MMNVSLATARFRPAKPEVGFQLASGEVHSWCVALDVPDETFAGLCATLTSDESNRSDRLRFAHDRRRFIVARGALRTLLASYLGAAPGRIRFVYNPFGKPALTPEFGDRIKFNLSHSGDLALIAVASSADLGIDLEYIRARPGDAELARCFFSDSEVEHLTRLPSHLHAHAFFRSWTRREAYVKARGEGLDLAQGDKTRAGCWSLFTLHPAPGYIGALAIQGHAWRLRQRRWHAPKS